MSLITARAAKVVRYSLKVDGTFYVVEAIPSSKAKVMVVLSAYMTSRKQKNSSTLNHVLQMADNPSSSATPETSHEILDATEDSISKIGENVKENQSSGVMAPILPVVEQRTAATETDGVQPPILPAPSAEDETKNAILQRVPENIRAQVANVLDSERIGVEITGDTAVLTADGAIAYVIPADVAEDIQKNYADRIKDLKWGSTLTENIQTEGERITSQPYIGKYALGADTEKTPLYFFETEQGLSPFQKKYVDALPTGDTLYFKSIRGAIGAIVSQLDSCRERRYNGFQKR